MVFSPRWMAGILVALAGCASVGLPDDSLNPQDLMVRGNLLLKEGNFEAASKVFDTLGYTYPLSPYVPEALLKSAYASFKQGDFDVAIAALNVFLNVYPHSPRASYALYLKGMCDYQRAGEPGFCQVTARRSAENFNQLLLLFPHSSQVPLATQALKNLKQRTEQHLFESAQSAYYAGRPIAALRHMEDLKGDEVTALRALCLQACGLADQIPSKASSKVT